MITEPGWSADALNRLLSVGGVWTHGPLTELGASRIGEDYGFGGSVYRVTATAEEGPVTLIAKVEDPGQVERAVTAYRHIGEALEGRIPALLGYSEDTILFEDISEAAQGDGLAEASRDQALGLIELVADLHTATWESSAKPWIPTHWTMGRWNARIQLAGERYPDQVNASLGRRLRSLHDEIPGAIAEIGAGPFCWTHLDVGFDNVLWRPDGSAVLLDWSSSAVANPAIDVAALLGFASTSPLAPEQTISAYTNELRARGVQWAESDATRSTVAALRLLTRGLVGFAGYPEKPTQPRLLSFRDTVLEYAPRALAWIDETEEKA